MSLKAKLEAVIYASEEPVTLAQLTSLLGEEGQAELETLAAQQHSLALEDEDALDATPAEPVEDADALNEEAVETNNPGAPGLASETPEVVPTEAHGDPNNLGAPDPDSETREVAPTEAAGDEQKPARDTAADTKAREAEQKLAARKLRDYFRSLLDQLIAEYTSSDRGLEIREVAGGFRLGTKPEYHDAVRGFVKSLKPPLKLTLQALETLAVVAYKQPVTAPEVSEIRGVESAGTLGSLMTRKLVTTAGRKQVIGRPILYKTTKDFLLRFGLKDINELPSIEEFEKMASELNEAIQEEIPMEAHEPNRDEPNDTDTPHKSSSPNDGGSPPIDELNAAPEPTHIHHDTPEDLMSDKSTHPEGHKKEDTHKSERAAESERATKSDFEPSAGIHSNQADGTPDDPDV